MVNQGLVSVIIPCFNSSVYIEQTLKSVLSQTYNNIELILVDDHSTDNTIDILKQALLRDKRVRVLTQLNRKGVSAARNAGIKESRGDYLAFIDHDDLWLPEKLSKQMALFRADKSVSLVFARASIFSDSHKYEGMAGGFGKPSRGYVFKQLLAGHFIPLPTVVIRREVFDGIDEWFVESMEMAEEIELFLRIAYKFKVDYCDEVLACWRSHPGNDSKLRLGLLPKDYKVIIERLQRFIPGFAVDYKKEIIGKNKWINMVEIKMLFAKGRKREAFNKLFSYIQAYGVGPDVIIDIPVILVFGFENFEKFKMWIINLYTRMIFPGKRGICFINRSN